MSNTDAGTTGAGPMVDARGLRCPIPVIRLAEAARSAAPGTEVTVLWTDPAARYDIPAWTRMRGHRLVATVPFTDADSPTPADDPPATPGDDPPPTPAGDTPAYATTIHLHP